MPPSYITSSCLIRFSYVGFDIKVQKQYEHEQVLYNANHRNGFWPFAFEEKNRVQKVNDQHPELDLQFTIKSKKRMHKHDHLFIEKH